MLAGLPVRCSGKLLVVTCCPDSQHCTLLVIIIVVNTIMIDVHANMHDRKQSGSKVMLEEEVPTELKVRLTLIGTLTSLQKHTTEDPALGCLSRRRIVKMIYFKL